MPTMLRLLRRLSPSIILLIGSITLINFLINVKAMVLLRSAFVIPSDGAADFQLITQGMLAKVIFPMEWDNPQFTNIDFFKLTSRYVSRNNQLVLWLSLIELVAVNMIGHLRRMARLRKPVTLIFGVVIISTPVVLRLSSSFGGF